VPEVPPCYSRSGCDHSEPGRSQNVTVSAIAWSGVIRHCLAIRKDPVQFRVAIPAADPPDNLSRL
jgi:hypothetical protein